MLDADADLRAQRHGGARGGALLRRLAPGLVVGEGQAPRVLREFGALAAHLRWTERHARKLARQIFVLMGIHQAGLEHKGALLGRVVDIGAELFAIAAACTYAHTRAGVEPDHADQVYELADLFCHQARRRADRLFSELHHNDDGDRYDAAQRLLAGRYDWFTEDILAPEGSDT